MRDGAKPGKGRSPRKPGPAVVRALRRGIALQQGGRIDEARAVYEEILREDPGQGDSLYLLGFLAYQAGDFEKAVGYLQRAATALGPHPATLHTLGASLQALGRLAEAIESYSNVLRVRPDYADALINRGLALQALHRHAEALADYDSAARLRPTDARVWTSRGKVLTSLLDYKKALASFDRAIRCDAGNVQAHIGRGDAQRHLKRYAEAVEAYDAARARDPDFPLLAGAALYTRMHLCDWQDFPARRDELVAAVRAGKPACTPFALLSLVDDPALHLQAAERYAQGLAFKEQALPRRQLNDRLRIGFYSADLFEHATARLMVELIEGLDRDKVEPIAFSFHPAGDTPLGRRIAAAFDQFIDVSAQSDEQVVAQSRSMEIDIAVDLKGDTDRARPRLFARRCAPLQLAYLGYPGSFAVGGIDYVLADAVVIPEGAEAHFTEQVIRLPQCYQPNDSQRVRAGHAGSRADHGLPDNAVVFCCFNEPRKILPELFSAWMAILREVTGSVLWLLEGPPGSADNLRAAAEAEGVDSRRIVFAPFAPYPDHLSRYTLADLFLDTFPYNAHTTASDALWAGLPLVTRAGQSFASRVGASLLTTLGMPELITESDAAYRALAIELARDAARRRALRDELAALRESSPLFSGSTLARPVETAFRAIAQRYAAGEPAGALTIAADGSASFES
ncbi:tetratricopeptide repeat protein [Pseudohaliea sp.]|uniref:O-linked N-acetylglucosamine transferase, SPINDLY family protein n=1 Tax=Pseudohaliea sp. TaxID=2740289 RepID=UPI0032EE689F